MLSASNLIKVDQIRLLVPQVILDNSCRILESHLNVCFTKLSFTCFSELCDLVLFFRFDIPLVSKVKLLPSIIECYCVIIGLNAGLKRVKEVKKGHERPWLPIGGL